MNRHVLRDERGLIVGTLLRIALFLVVLGVVGIETTSVVFNRLQTQDTAEQASFEAASEYLRTRDVSSARLAAEQRVIDRDPTAQLRQFEVRTDGSVRVLVYRRARTLFIHRIDFLKKYTEARGRAVSEAPPA